jgi:hypothetical protein
LPPRGRNPLFFHGIQPHKTKKPVRKNWLFCFISLVPLTGIELVTFALRMRCSTD